MVKWFLELGTSFLTDDQQKTEATAKNCKNLFKIFQEYDQSNLANAEPGFTTRASSKTK